RVGERSDDGGTVDGAGICLLQERGHRDNLLVRHAVEAVVPEEGREEQAYAEPQHQQDTDRYPRSPCRWPAPHPRYPPSTAAAMMPAVKIMAAMPSKITICHPWRVSRERRSAPAAVTRAAGEVAPDAPTWPVLAWTAGMSAAV